MNAVDLFAGAGGASIGLKTMGFSVASVELDPDIGDWHRCAVGDCTIADVADYLTRQVFPTSVDLLWASPPCQPYSRAGKQLGEKDPRDKFPLVRDAIRALRPAHVVVENVRGSEPSAEALAEWMRGNGYPSARVATLNAADFGVPQHRRRVFVTTLPIPRPTHADPAALGMRPRPPREGEEQRTHYDRDVARGPSLAALMNPPMRPWRTVRDALPGLAAEARIATGQNTWQGRRRVPHTVGIDEPSPTLRARNRGAPASLVQGTTSSLSTAGSEPWRLDAPSCAVTTTEEKGTRASPSSGGRFNGGPDRASDVAFLATGRRRLTVEECAVLQGFPAGLPWGDFRTKTLAYRGVGNAVPPDFAAALVSRWGEG